MTTLKPIADHLASQGRYGDTILVHMNPVELRALEILSGQKASVNPKTGQPEGFAWLPFLAMAAAGAGLSGAATHWDPTSMILGGLGGGLAGALAPGLLGARAAAQAASTAGTAASAAAPAAAATGAGALATPTLASLSAAPVFTPAAQSLGALAVSPLAASGASSLATPALASLNAVPTFAPTAASGLGAWAAAHPLTAGTLGLSVLNKLGGTSSTTKKSKDDDSGLPKRVYVNNRTYNPIGDVSGYGRGDGGEHTFFNYDNSTPSGVDVERVPANYQYASGGRIRGPRGGINAGGAVPAIGDGLSDSVPAMGPGGRPIQLAADEHVIPADAVAALGNGSSNAGHRALKGMVERIRKQSFGHPNQMRPVDGRYLPA